MININFQNGRFSLAGNLDIILTEYTSLTKLLVMELRDITSLETAFDITTTLGNMAVEDLDKGIEECNNTELCKRIADLLDDKLMMHGIIW